MKKKSKDVQFLKKRKNNAVRDAPKGKGQKRTAGQQGKTASAWLCSNEAWDTLICKGYTSLAHNPEICTAVDTIARLVGSMTIHLMESRDGGDVRVKNALSYKLDVQPNRYMTRSGFVQWVVKTLYLEGRGNAFVWPSFAKGGANLSDLQPIPPYMASCIADGWGYQINIGGKMYEPDEVLHFVLNPSSSEPWRGEGYHIALSDVANNLKQAAATEKGFMESKWKPSIIVKVDALTDEFSSPEGRKRLLDDYISTTHAGEPWLVPAEQFSIEQVKPLTLADLALADFVKLDKQTVAAILGVPSFVLGVGDFNRNAWNNFINTTIMPIARAVEQELTKKLLYSDSLYFRFNSWSLFSYSITELVEAGAEMVDRMALRRNEWRGWLNLPPDKEMDELLALENYIPANKLKDQKKLIQNKGEEE